MKPDFTKYSLALVKNNKIIHSSDKSGLRPLVECIIKYKSKIKNCVLHDKIIGLAAARIIVYSGIVSKVLAQISSMPAKELLDKNNIKIQTQNIVDNILNKDKSAMCRMELKAQSIDDNEAFFLHMKYMLKL